MFFDFKFVVHNPAKIDIVVYNPGPCMDAILTYSRWETRVGRVEIRIRTMVFKRITKLPPKQSKTFYPGIGQIEPKVASKATDQYFLTVDIWASLAVAYN